MRIPKTWVPGIAQAIMKELLKKGLIEIQASEEQVTRILEELIIDELMVEDRLNQEVREILKKYDAEIERGKLDYRKLFELTKQRLVKERNIIL